MSKDIGTIFEEKNNKESPGLGDEEKIPSAKKRDWSK